MLKRLIDQLVAEAAKKVEAKASLPGRHFLTVWRQDDRYHLRINWTASLDQSLPGLVAQAAGWEDWKHEIGTNGLEYSGRPSLPDQPALAKPARKRTGHYITEEQRRRLLAIAGNQGINHADLKVLIDRLYNAKSTKEILPSEYEELCESIIPAGRAYLDSVNWFKEGRPHAS